MAQDAGIADVWAKHGEAQQHAGYDLLREVTHWTDADVERERQIRQRDINPTYVLENSFSELLDQFQFGDADAK